MKTAGSIILILGLLLTYAMAFASATADGAVSPVGSDVARTGQADDAWHGYFGIGVLLVGCVVLGRRSEPA